VFLSILQEMSLVNISQEMLEKQRSFTVSFKTPKWTYEKSTLKVTAEMARPRGSVKKNEPSCLHVL
jgi:hypothetical protein